MAEKIYFLANGLDFILEDEDGQKRYFERKFAEAQKISKNTGRPTAVDVGSGHIYFTDTKPKSECPFCDAGVPVVQRRRLS